MFNLGPDKMIIIFVLALVLLGPEELPGAARRLGEFMRVVRSYSDGFRHEMNSMVEHVTGLDPSDPWGQLDSAPAEKEHPEPLRPEFPDPAISHEHQDPDAISGASPSGQAETGLSNASAPDATLKPEAETARSDPSERPVP